MVLFFLIVRLGTLSCHPGVLERTFQSVITYLWPLKVLILDYVVFCRRFLLKFEYILKTSIVVPKNDWFAFLL